MNLKMLHKFRTAVHLLVACGLSEELVAAELKVTQRTIRNWMRNPVFAEMVRRKQVEVEKFDAKKHRRTNNAMLSQMAYAEIQRKILEEDALAGMSISGLLRLARDLNFENRLDNNEPTARDEHKLVLEDMMKRYQQALKRGDQSVQPKTIDGRPQLALVEGPRERPRKEQNHGRRQDRGEEAEHPRKAVGSDEDRG